MTLQAIQDRPLISLPRGTGVRACLDAACTMAGFQPRIAFEASNLQVVAQLARRGLGPAAVPKSTALLYPDELHAVAVMSPEMRGCLALAWRAEDPVNPATRVFASHARAALAGPPFTGAARSRISR
ncbi:MAG: LysR substrate-binding domain-containing protein [Symbiobacteriia bacterium]